MGTLIQSGGTIRITNGATLIDEDGFDAAFSCQTKINSYVADVLTDSPAVFYRMNETAGPTAFDSSGNARNGTYIGNTFFQLSPGPICANDVFVSQDGVGDDSLDLATDGTLDLIGSNGQDFTFEAWTFNLQSGSAIIEKTLSPNWNSLALVGSLGGRPRFQLLDGANNPFVDGTTFVNNMSWYHIVGTCTWAATVPTVRLYVNGVQEGGDITGPAAMDSANPGRKIEFMDRDQGSGADSAEGSFAYCAIYLSALSLARIQSHYNKATA